MHTDFLTTAPLFGAGHFCHWSWEGLGKEWVGHGGDADTRISGDELASRKWMAFPSVNPAGFEHAKRLSMLYYRFSPHRALSPSVCETGTNEVGA